MSRETKRRLIHMEQFAPTQHIECNETAAFFREDGCETEIKYGEVWVLYVWKREVTGGE